MVNAILDLLDNVAKIWLKSMPGFDVSTIQKINDLRTMYDTEMGKNIADVDAAKLDSIELELRNLILVFNTSIQGANAPAQSSSAGASGVPSS